MYNIYNNKYNINQPDLQNLSSFSELPTQVSIQPLKEISIVVHAVSVPSVCLQCPLRGNRPNCNHYNRFV